MSDSTLQERTRPRPLYPQLRARRNASPAAVNAHQRTRLHAAMIEACAERGYADSTVNYVVSLAGVSKKTLYKHFESKEACFLSTYDLVVSEAVGRISAAYREESNRERDWAAGLCRAFECFAAELVERPKPSRLALVEVLAAGGLAQDRIERVESVFARMIAQGIGQAPDGIELPRWLLRSLVSGIWFVSRNRVLEGQPEAVASQARELYEWILAYRSPAAVSIASAAERPVREAPFSVDVDGDARTRMMVAAARIASDGGFRTMTGAQIAERAAVEIEAFAAEFENARDCFLSSLELLSVHALAAALRESREAPDWPASVCRATRSMLREIARDRLFARAAFVDVFAAGAPEAKRRAALMRSFARLLERRAPAGREPRPFVAEAIVGSVWSLAHRHVLHDRGGVVSSLWPQAAYLILAPVLGAEAAVAAIQRERGLLAKN